MPFSLPTAASAPAAPANAAADEERWRMFVRASLMGAPAAEGGAAQAYRRMFAQAAA
jgi:hypothetical protein